MTIPAPLPPPAAADIDAYMLDTAMIAQFISQAEASQASGVSTPISMRAVVFGWTNHDGTFGFTAPGQLDPAADGQSTLTARGLVAEYGAVVARVYQWTFTPLAVADVAAPDSVQAAANDPATWVSPL